LNLFYAYKGTPVDNKHMVLFSRLLMQQSPFGNWKYGTAENTHHQLP
jgi:hypothetical protein